MRTVHLLLVILTALSAGHGCGESSHQPNPDSDGGTPDAALHDGPAGRDGAADAFASDVSLGNNFGLAIPAGTRACTMFKATRDFFDAKHEYGIKGRITFKPGLVVLYRDKASFSSDWIQKLELGPDRDQATASGPGTFKRTLKGTPDDGKYQYDYERSYTWRGKAYKVTYRAVFKVKGGVPEAKVVTFDEKTLSDFQFPLEGTVGSGADALRQTRTFLTCRYTKYFKMKGEVVMANKDRLELEMAMEPNICKICNAALIKAVYTSGSGEKRTVTDHFRLAYSASWHNWSQQLLIVFDKPVGNIHGIFLDEESTMSQTKPDEARYLDAKLKTISSSKVVKYGWK